MVPSSPRKSNFCYRRDFPKNENLIHESYFHKLLCTADPFPRFVCSQYFVVNDEPSPANILYYQYIFAALYRQGGNIYNMNVVYVDYDGGAIGAAIRDAYSTLQADTFPTLVERSASEYPTPQDLRNDVCKTRYWGAIFTSAGASNRLETALTTGSTYNKNDAIAYIWNEARYSTIVDSAISGNIQTLSNTARVMYATNSTVTNLNTASYPLFVDPWHLKSVNIQTTTQGSRLIYNTLVFILVLIQEFFYLGSVNSLYEAFHVYSRLNPHRIIVFRSLISLSYTFIGSLCVIGMIWAFRAGWDVDGVQFVLSWMILWLFAHVNFLTLDVFTVWLPPPYIPMALISWVVFNVTSILIPFELCPAFFRYGYIYPAHEVYQVLIDIWSRGCNPKLSQALPILFALEISGFIISSLGIHRRCHYAIIREENEKLAFQNHLDDALVYELGKRNEDSIEKRESVVKGTDSDDNKENKEKEGRDVEKDRTELSRVITKADEEMRRAQTNGNVSFGPAFGFGFGQGSDE